MKKKYDYISVNVIIQITIKKSFEKLYDNKHFNTVIDFDNSIILHL